MTTATAAQAPQAQLTVLQSMRASMANLARHGVIVAAFCTLIAFVLWLARPDQRLDVQLVYSFATGMTSWLLIDTGRFFVDRHSPFGFPRGWRGMLLIFAGVSAGFVVGTLAGDAYTGRSRFGLIPNQPRFVL